MDMPSSRHILPGIPWHRGQGAGLGGSTLGLHSRPARPHHGSEERVWHGGPMIIVLGQNCLVWNSGEVVSASRVPAGRAGSREQAKRGGLSEGVRLGMWSSCTSLPGCKPKNFLRPAGLRVQQSQETDWLPGEGSACPCEPVKREQPSLVLVNTHCMLGSRHEHFIRYRNLLKKFLLSLGSPFYREGK